MKTERVHELAVEVGALLLRANPMRLAPRSDTEYWPEAREIAPLLHNCESEDEITDVVHAIFVKFFNPPHYDPGQKQRYQQIGKDIWNLLKRFEREDSIQTERSSSATTVPSMITFGEDYTDDELNLIMDKGIAQINGDGVPRNFKEGHALVTKAAEKGYLDAQFVLGMMYDDGVVISSIIEAKTWYEKAATRGHRRAQYRLGVLLTRPGVTRDLEAAAGWILKAATQGHSSAQRDIGLMYFHGDGVSHNREEAKRWLEKAAAQGDVQAGKELSYKF